ncbi:HAD-superfamily hydrolase, subfamily IA, variant 1 [Halorubrum distributum JCM 9100]|uniref:HAD-superfamily hydrolase, subfamily IA, variant 1 n=5 Tax=Halorubrum distributum TaxID=29283 RepID=M0ERX3_9EURY|nr:MULTISPECIES: HAD hydrolase-like protein [Halorubrum distributum group]ELZ49169.1 HAD-superfamily hydrolase, subfamily IA, variant 1 [Halorubrum distributum JCM 9100]ELZ57769.1 HAD-superfamily hydrolase, subfamily IA, variant 1 [Halorubrum distributum JCM 10118]EMA59970.1 HAD-superfamily hydrolase, subfamily IA, variant 1 [Halorubrum litoreum JCM 13561]EMA69913.1 HAD-superfamily hydrolase, subfamily IA, variant 1 [Halorubrum arcis JCM 13916]MYL15738.1 HAD hydrolase-like protein [Halorubrum 
MTPGVEGAPAGADGTPAASGTDPVGSRLAGYDAVVYDLDGTLVELAVDWDAVADDVLDAYAERALIPPTEELWDLLGAADDYGIRAEVEAAIAGHERPGARESARLPLGDRLTGTAAGADAGSHPPAGVCSLNCEEACRIAVETHGLDDALVSDAIVGRDTVETRKPDPASLLAAIDRIGAAPEDALFVGDSRSDAVTAERGGVDFAWVADLVAE